MIVITGAKIKSTLLDCAGTIISLSNIVIFGAGTATGISKNVFEDTYAITIFGDTYNNKVFGLSCLALANFNDNVIFRTFSIAICAKPFSGNRIRYI